MATPKQGYHLGGDKLPGVTTVIGRFKDSGPLMFWAFNQGKSGAERLYDKAEKAADIGTLAHEMIETHINGEDPIVDLDNENSVKAFNAYSIYLKWEQQTNLEFLSKYQEIQLVCPEYGFGGTPDAIGKIDGEICLLDWKTSNGVYRDYLIQLAAYQHLVNNGVRMDTGEPLDLKITGGLHLCRFSKDFPDFEHRYFQEASLAWEQFKLFLQAYQIDKKLKERVK